MRILLLDDDSIILEILEDFLKKIKHEVFAVTDAYRAMDKINVYHGDIDILISDICLPSESGISLLEKIKQLYPNIDVVLMTGEPDIIKASDALSKGACAYIRKPIRLAELNILINQISKTRQDRGLINNLTRELKKERKRHEEYFKDILFIKKLHARLFPADFSWLKRTRVHIKYLPMTAGSGDYIDIRPYGENNALVFAVDISGHGIPAMFGCIALKAYLSSVRTGLSPNKILEEAENVLSETLPEEFFATAFCGIYNEKDRTLNYSLAACPFPYILSPLGKGQLLKGNGLALCMKGNTDRECHKITINEDDVLIVYTDGLINNSYIHFENLNERFKLNDDSGKIFKNISNLVTIILDTAIELDPFRAFSDDLAILALGPDYSTHECDLMPSLQDKKILSYVNDSETIINLEKHLKDQGCKLIIYKDSSNFISDIKELMPDVILSDIYVYGKNGLEILNILRETNLKLPIIMMAENNTIESIKACLSKNAAGFLKKPFEKYTLIKVIQNAISIDLEKEIIYFDNVSFDWMDFVISSSPSALDILERYLLLLERQLIPNHIIEDVLYCIKEMGRNAIEWGNLHNPDFKVRISTVVLSDRVMIKIADEGSGFDVKKALLQKDMIFEKQLEREKIGKRDGGFGLLIVQEKMDSVKFNDKGNVVLMTKML